MAVALKIDGNQTVAFAIRIDGTLYIPADPEPIFGGGTLAFVPESDAGGEGIRPRPFRRVLDISGPVYIPNALVVTNGVATNSGGYLGTVTNRQREYYIEDVFDQDRREYYSRRTTNVWTDRSIRTLGIVPGPYRGGLVVSGLHQATPANWSINWVETVYPGKQALYTVFLSHTYPTHTGFLMDYTVMDFTWNAATPTDPDFVLWWTEQSQYSNIGKIELSVAGALVRPARY